MKTVSQVRCAIRSLTALWAASLLWHAPLIARDQQSIIRDGRSAIACIVAPADSIRGERALTVQIRTPTVSHADVIARLPHGAEGFTALPVRVSLLDRTGARSKQYPTLVDRELKNPVVEGTPLSDKFISVVFSKERLIPGTVILAERSVIARDGGRIASQTTCAITESDATKWRE